MLKEDIISFIKEVSKMKHIHTFENKSKAKRAISYLSTFFNCTEISYKKDMMSGQLNTPYYFYVTGTRR